MQLLAGGPDIIDIGGQSTRPGAEIISVTEELARVLPAVRLARERTALPISVDTFKPAVAEAALQAGANIINDVHGCRDAGMVELVRRGGVRVVVMHSRGDPKTMPSLTDYPGGIVPSLIRFFEERIAALTAAGIKKEQLIIDPGIGFAQTGAQSFEVTQHLAEFRRFGVPVLYAASQKSFIGKALAHENGEMAPPDERVPGTIITNAYAIIHGADIIRVHDVALAAQVRRVAEAIMRPDAVRG